MSSNEENNEDWKELRSRVDTLCSAIFLVAGGALTLSINVFLTKEAASSSLLQSTTASISCAWYSLFVSIAAFVVLKAYIIWQSYLRNTAAPEWFNQIRPWSNGVGWLIGVTGLFSFLWGLYLLVKAAAALIGA